MPEFTFLFSEGHFSLSLPWDMEPTVGLGLAAAGVGTFAVYKVQLCNKFIMYEEQSLGFQGTDGIELTLCPRWYDRTSDTERHATSAARIVRSVSLL